MNKRIVILGDLFAIAIITFIGFATHGETGLSFLPRMAAIYIPLAFSWFLLVPGFGLFQDEVTSNPSQLWRPALAALFAASFAAVLRGILLNTPIIPIFAAVLGAASALGMVTWRTIWFWLRKR